MIDALPQVAGLIEPGANLGQLGLLLWIAVKLGKLDALAVALGARLGSLEVWAAGRGHIFKGK